MATATDPTTWVRAVRASHDRLAGLVAGLNADDLRAPSYDTDWSVADVLSHLGSGAEITALSLEAGERAPRRPRLTPSSRSGPPGTRGRRKSRRPGTWPPTRPW